MRWHYTTGQNFRLIVEDQLIKPATAHISWREKPAVWFSTHPLWELTAYKARRTPDGSFITISRDETTALGGGIVRFSVAPDTAPHYWTAFKRLSGVPRQEASRMAKVGKEQGADPRQ